MRKILLTYLVGSFLFTSCQNQGASVDKVSFDSSIVTSTKPFQKTDSTTVQPLQNQVQNLPATSTSPTTTISTNPAPVTTTAAVAPGMNPAHGQPGHRCDIAVGAPLNSPAGKSATTPVTPVTSVTSNPAVTSTITPTAVKTAPGMNPPHGQPGHKCEIAVGAPLNSPATKTTNANNDAKANPTEVVVPATKEAVVKDTAMKQ